MADSAKADLMTLVRGRISDERPVVTAFTFALSATGNCRSCILEVRQGHFSTDVDNGNGVESLRFNLTDPRYSTIGRLIGELGKRRGYTVTPEAGYMSDRPSADLVLDGMVELASKAVVTLRHRYFSDAEIAKFVQDAIALHNPNYAGPASVPRGELPLVATKAAALALGSRAADAAQRKGMAEEAATLLSLKQNLDTQYRDDTQRLKRILPSPKADESKMGAGDVVVGHLTRDSLRFGGVENYRHALAQPPPKLYDPQDDDIGDTTVRLRWSTPKDANFAYFEIWRSTVRGVERNLSGRIFSPNTPQIAENTQYSQVNEARQVMGIAWAGTSPIYDGMYFGTWAENTVAGTTYLDGYLYPGAAAPAQAEILHEPLEPQTEYFYRVYAIDRNRQVTASEEKRYETRPMRARFGRLANDMFDPSAVLPSSGPIAGGTTISIDGKNLLGAKVKINGKEAAILTQTSIEITVQTPAFYNERLRGTAVDIVLVSPSGLKDILQGGFRYT